MAKLKISFDDKIAVNDEESNTAMGVYELTDLDGHIFLKEEVRIKKQSLVAQACFKDGLQRHWLRHARDLGTLGAG